MSRRVSLPGADQPDRPMHPEEDAGRPADPPRNIHAVPADGADGEAMAGSDVVSDVVSDVATPADSMSVGDAAEPRSSGRVRHDEKMTVYVTADELFELETARLSLRHRHGVAVDRGRLVREAIAIVLSDLDQQGADSSLARRLTVS